MNKIILNQVDLSNRQWTRDAAAAGLQVIVYDGTHWQLRRTGVKVVANWWPNSRMRTVHVTPGTLHLGVQSGAEFLKIALKHMPAPAAPTSHVDPAGIERPKENYWDMYIRLKRGSSGFNNPANDDE